MLIVDRKELKLQKKFLKVNNVSPALDNTFVVLGVAKSYQDCLTHLSADGKVIEQIDFV